MERPPYLSLHTPEKAAMSQQIAQTRQIVAYYCWGQRGSNKQTRGMNYFADKQNADSQSLHYVWVVNGIEYLRNGPTLHSKN